MHTVSTIPGRQRRDSPARPNFSSLPQGPHACVAYQSIGIIFHHCTKPTHLGRRRRPYGSPLLSGDSGVLNTRQTYPYAHGDIQLHCL